MRSLSINRGKSQWPDLSNLIVVMDTSGERNKIGSGPLEKRENSLRIWSSTRMWPCVSTVTKHRSKLILKPISHPRLRSIRFPRFPRGHRLPHPSIPFATKKKLRRKSRLFPRQPLKSTRDGSYTFPASAGSSLVTRAFVDCIAKIDNYSPNRPELHTLTSSIIRRWFITQRFEHVNSKITN